MESICDFLASHAKLKSNDEAFTFIEDSGEKSQISFSALHQNAKSIAQHLTTEYESGDRVVLLFPPGLEYIQAFLGCLYAGVVAVPLYPPQSKKHAGRVLTVIEDCDANLILTNNALKTQLEDSLVHLTVMSFEQLAGECPDKLLNTPTADQVAFLQYTSGSTGKPKGVVVSHGNIVANLKTLQQATLCSQEDVFCNWLPLFHDLGLVNTLLLPIYLGAHSILMSPVRFIKKPLAWLEAITEYKASICGAPNFAFDHCVDRIKPHQLASVNLSSWRIAFNAAEPVDADTLMRFCDRFSRTGFKESAIFPAYGMAEATVFICGGAHATSYLAHPFSSEALQKGQAKFPDNSEKQQILIGHGLVQAEHQLKIVSPETLTELADGQVGEILFAGPSLAQGYWNDTEKTEASFGVRLDKDSNEYLRTGDLGFIHQGELYISGRIKDVMIVKGRNYYPQDFEKAAYSAYLGLNKNGASAFEVNGKAFLLLEVSRDMQKQFDYKLACEVIQAAIFEHFEVVLEDIVFLKAGRLNRTSSGKIQRSLIKTRYISDDIDYLYSLKNGQHEEASSQSNLQVAALSELELGLCALWKEVFGLEHIGVEDNFLNLGGHSLLAASLISKIQKKWNVDLSIRSFFTANTIRKLANVIENTSTSQILKIQPTPINDSLLPSYAQERLWFVHQIESGQAQYNLSFSLKLYGDLDNSSLHQAFETILTRHRALRTTFKERDGQVFQIIQESFQFDIPSVNLTQLTKTEQEQKVAEISEEEAKNTFDLSQDLMLRVKLIELDSQIHIMLLTVHHIAADGWSMGILTKELNVLYSASVQGLDDPLSPLGIQYIDYAHWQRNWLKEDILQSHLCYWKEHLSNLPAIHSLPLDYTRPAIQSFNGASIHHKLSVELQDDLRNLAREHDATFFMLMNAAFASFLSRYSGENDIAIGSPIANREQEELAPLIGIFINNLVFRSDLSADPSFLELLSQSKERTFAAYEHQQVPFEKLVDELQPERSLSHSPLFQVMLTLQNQDIEPLSLYGLDTERLHPRSMVAQYDLTLTLHESENGLGMEWEYATDLFSQSTIERMIGHFEVLLSGILKSPETKVSQLPLLSNDESLKVLRSWNDTAEEYPQGKCIHEMFEQQVEINPNAVAAVFNDEQLTYKELNQRANQLAHYLVKHGAKPDSVVGICVERSLESLVGVLAIMKSGGAYLPMDPAYPKARLAYMVEDSEVQVVITQKNLSGLFEVEQIVCLDTEDFAAELTQFEYINLDKESLGLTANNLSYLIYTSGSTGKPKGVMLEHRNLTNFLISMRKEPGLNKEDVLLAVTSFSFDIHALELYLPLIVGGCVTIASSENVLSPDELVQLIDEQRVTCMQATPATWKMLVNSGWKPERKLKALCGGEALSNTLKDALLSLECLELWNMYGPTETAVWSASTKIEGSISLGAPIANTQFYVLDSHLSPVPIGVAGELYIGGEGVARGYLNRPELTDEKFIQNPFSDTSNTRLYKTGDLVRWLPEGTVEYLRRVDLQVKVRGHRIELEEIESGLKRHLEVDEALAHVWNDGDSSNLVAYVTGKCADTEQGLQEKLTGHLDAFLPAYMVPNRFVCLEKIPLTPNGKIDRRALPKPQFNAELEYIAPETETEKDLCRIWQELLNLEVKEEQGISVTSNFFHLGGHSLLAARLVSQIREHWKVEVPIRTLFIEQTIRKLAKVIENAMGSHVPRIVPLPGSQPVAISYDQQRLWLLDQIEQGSNQYNLCRGFKLLGGLDLEALKLAFQKIVERHHVLRTTFQKTESGDATQAVSGDFDLAIPMLNLNGLCVDEQKQMVQQHIQEETERAFNLSMDLMIRVKLLQFSEEAHALLVTMHHIAVDGWSEGIIINEFATLYRSFVEQQPDSLPELEIQYTDYSRWQNDRLQGKVLENYFQYWKDQLRGIPEVHNLPLDHARPAIQSFEGATYHQHISKEIQQGLHELARKYDVTLFMVLNAAYAVLLSRYSNEEDIVVGAPIANREQAELAPLVGFFVNTLVLRTDLSDNPTFETLLSRSKEYLLGAYEHQQLPFEKLVDELQPDRSLSYSPLIQVKLALQNNELGKLELPGLSISDIEQEQSVSKLDLSLDIFEINEDSENGMLFVWEYATSLFNTSTIEQMGRHFEMLLREVIKKPEEVVGQIQILTAAESQLLLNADEKPLSNLALDCSNTKCIHELFEEQVERNPNAVAVIYSAGRSGIEERLSYSELNAAANQVAHYLVEQGVKPDTLVGLCVERSLEMIIGQLGILKAGGAYVPIDPGYPEERIEFILEDSGVEILLTENELLSELPINEQQILPLDEEIREALLGDYSEENIIKESHPNGIPLSPNHLAYVIYTSGSTGQPKGVLIEHSGIVNLAKDMQMRFGYSEDTCILQYYSFAFDAGAEDWIGALTCGGRLRLISNDDLLDLTILTEVVNTSNVTHLHVPPSVLAFLDPDSMPSVKTVEAGGEKYSQELVDRWGKDKQFFNVYGPTETSISSSFKQCRVNDDVMSIGQAIPNVYYYVLDRHHAPCPIGVAGELFIGGAGLGRGYINQPELTAEKFIGNPFNNKGSDTASKRLYCTGDLVRWIPGTQNENSPGELEFLGRIDQQVKIRGFRVELSEVESVLSQHEKVNEVAVIDRDTPKKLVAFYTRPEHKNDLSTQDSEQLIDSLIMHLKQSLPDYMMPSAFVMLEQLPLTSNGKVDRKALLDIDVSAQLTTQKYVSPETEIEKQLCDIWQNLLKIEEVGITDNFFALGGDSILAIQVVNRCTQVGLTLTTRQLFESQTIEKLAEQVNTQQSNAENNPMEYPTADLLQNNNLTTDIRKKVEVWQQTYPRLEKAYVTTGMQRGMLFHSSLDASAYVSQLSITLTGALNVKALKCAISAIIRRHNVYRTVFTDDFACQLVLSDVALPLIQVDLSEFSEQERQLRLAELIAKDKAQGFDFNQAPLMRITLVRLSDEQHCLIWSNHHALSDGWSLPLVFKEVMSLYAEADRQGVKDQETLLSVLPEVQPYGHYIAWLNQQSADKASAFWKSTLSRFETPTKIDVNRITHRELHGPRKQLLKLTPEVTAQLQGLSRHHQVTLNTIIQAAWAYLLHSYCRENQVTFGETVSGRPAEIVGVEHMVGLFINTLPVVVDIDLSQEIGAWLKGMHSASIDRTEHGFLPLFDIQKLSPEITRVGQERNLFDTLVVFENYPVDQEIEKVITDSGLSVVDINNDEQTNYGLTLTVLPGNTDLQSTLSFELSYRTERYEEATIKRVLSQLNVILTGLLDSTYETVGDLPVLTDEEKYKLLIDWNDTTSGYAHDKCIHELFEEQVERHPNAVAVVFDDENGEQYLSKDNDVSKKLTYRELNAKANQVAHHLIELEVKPDTLIGLCTERSLEMVVGLLGILKAGGAYVPLDPSYPRDRLGYLLADASLEVVLSQSEVADLLPDYSGQLVLLDDVLSEDGLFTGYSNKNLPVSELGLQSSQLAYVIYTSGSTGRPKGVMIEHRSVLNYLSCVDGYLTENIEHSVMSTSLNFDATVTSLFGAWLKGKCLTLFSEREGVFEVLTALMSRDVAGLFKVTPAHLQGLILNEPVLTPHVVVVGGDVFSRELAVRVSEKLPNTCFINEYGPTESTVGCSNFKFIGKEVDSYLNALSIPIGCPMHNTQLYVLNEQQAPVPMGVVGELYIGGNGVARGYLNQPLLTKEKFIPNPFLDDPDARLYKTGDLVRWLDDTQSLSANIEFVGRIDNQVKVRGFRIELGEIESTLLTHHQVAEALVVVHIGNKAPDAESSMSDFDKNVRLVAYIVLSPEAENIISSLDAEGVSEHMSTLFDDFRKHLEQVLPDYMVPSSFMVVEEFPLNHNGKIDRKALPEPDNSAMQTKEYVAPRTDAERKLCDVWQGLLNIEKVSVTDNFFAIGGDSILSIQAVSRCAQAGLVFTTRQLYEKQTIEELALEVNLQSKLAIPQEAVVGEQVLLPVQQDFLLTDFVDQNHYNQSVLLKIPEEFSFAVLREVVWALYQRHDVLRLSVEQGKAKYIPLDQQLADRAIQCHDLSQLDDNEWKLALFEKGSSIKAGLSLKVADIFRAVLFKGRYGQSRLLLTLHHIAVDGVSWRIILQDMTQAFEQLQQQETIQLPLKSSSFQKWGEFLLDYAHSDGFELEKDYWISQTQEQVPALPVGNCSVDNNCLAASEVVSFELTSAETDALLNQCTSTYRTQINDLLLSGLYLGLREWTGQSKFRIDLEGHGRESITDSVDLTQTVGWFTSIFPLNLIAESNASISNVIKTIKEQLREVPNKGIGFGLLKRYSADQAGISDALPSDILFNYLGQFDQSVNENSQFQAASENVGEDISLQRQRSHLFELTGMVSGGRLALSLSYNRLQHDQSNVELLMQSIKSALCQVIEHCRSPMSGGVTPSDFPLSDVNQVQLDEWYHAYPGLVKLYPTTGMQKGILFHSSLDVSAYVSQFSLDLEGPLNRSAMHQAWDAVVNRHEAFRTIFSKDHTLQLVLSEVELPFKVVDLCGISAEEQKQRLAQLLKDDKARGFDLEQIPLMRITLVILSEQRYRLTWSSHHALSDGWSLPIVLKEVLAFYQSLNEGRSVYQSNLLLPKVQCYEGYIEWLQRQDHEKARLYWDHRLINEENSNHGQLNARAGDKLSDHSTPIIERSRKQQEAKPLNNERMYSVTLTQEKSVQLQSLAQSHHVTLSTLFHAAWAYLLHCYSGQNQVVFGETVSGRPAELAGVEEMVGMFINSVPVRVDVELEKEIGAWLQSIHQNSIDRGEYGFLPLYEIQELNSADQNQNEGGLASRSLFNTLLVFDNYPVDQAIAEDMENSELTVTDMISDLENNFGLTLRVSPGAGVSHDQLDFALIYQLENYEKETVIRIGEHLETVLTGLLNRTLKTVGELPLLTSQEEQQLLIEWNDTSADYPKDKCIHQLFAEQVAINPEKVAVVYEDPNLGTQQLSYQQLYNKSYALALYLQSQGVRPDTLVGLYTDRTLGMMVGILGTLQAGCAYVPLDPDYPDNRLTYMLDDSQADIIVTLEKFNDKLKALTKKDFDVIVLDDEYDLPSGCIEELSERGIELQEDVKSDNLAYVIYTSGSTGQPKGVMVEHKMVVDYCHSVVNKMDLDQCDTFAAVSTFSSDLGNLALYVPMLFGKTLYVFSNEYVNNPIELHSYLSDHPIDCMKITPSHFEMFKVSDSKIITVSKALIFAGEPLTKPIVDLVNKLNPDCKVFNNYGPTETTISKIASSALNSANTSGAVSICLGRPLNNAQVYILDKNQNPVPVGVPGELHISGDGVARGYLNRPELTEEKFIPNPFSKGAVMYKTGDLARWLDDGNIEYLGRIDNQVKIRGFRIETAEIETILNQYTGISSTVVVVQGEESSEGVANKQLVAYYVSDTSEQTLDSDELKEHLLKTLPEYMVPAAFVNLEAIPLMSNGKADRLALEQMNISLASGEVYVAPRNKLDEKLVGIWAEILQIEPETIGINDDFFSLGGHSLLAVMLVSKIKRELEVALPLQALFNLKTIRGTADYIIANTTKPWEQLEEFLEGEESPEGDFVEGAL